MFIISNETLLLISYLTTSLIFIIFGGYLQLFTLE